MSKDDEGTTEEVLRKALRETLDTGSDSEDGIEYVTTFGKAGDVRGIAFHGTPGSGDLTLVMGGDPDDLSCHIISERKALIALKNVIQAVLEGR